MTDQAPDAPAKPKKIKFPVNRPKTKFNMKANLVQNEPASVKRWEKQGLYQQMLATNAGKADYWFHDGPPYANGSIHLGHLLNKVLKDFVVRSKTMAGFHVPYVPGWDCHGLPIEHKVMQELGDKAKDMDAIAIRRKCKSYAEKHVKNQKTQMKRLLTVADYDDPYLTMNPRYEAATLEVFADVVKRGVVYRGLKPVHWSVENQTALADAELEYYDREDTSVYVKFNITPGSGSLDLPSGGSLMIWTTTPWTLPANIAVAVHPRFTYGLYELPSGDSVIVATELAAKVLKLGGVENADEAQPVKTFTGEELAEAGVEYQHPFCERTGRVVAADYVTAEDGTGMVHTAPGHGVEDYQTGLRENLDIYCPVLADGTYDDTVPEWLQGTIIWDANKLVCDRLEESGHMFHQHQFMHSYPHDWRGKSPVIFRATEQWFVDVNKPFAVDGSAEEVSIKDRALAETADDVHFLPAWGKNRMRGMLETRPDWCLSRQRAWGLPIPAFYCEGESEPLLTAKSVKAVADVFREKGSDSWFLMSPEELLANYDAASDSDAPAWAKEIDNRQSQITKSTDIFDVWWESGSSWNAVMRQRFGQDSHPTDLYLEGSDQHRGWFQLSLLPSLAVTGKAPFKTVLTHGFMVAKDGTKMSKSLGNAVEVEDLMKDLGADVCRWWVASLNTDNDIKVDWDFFKLAGEEYRKIRNTLRFLLSNTGDYEGDYTWTEADNASVDAWALGELNTLIDNVTAAYEALSFRRVRELLFDFCNDTLSAMYATATKDRLYCDAPDSPRRRRTQCAMRQIAEAVIKLMAPILPHTADETWGALTGDKEACVQLLDFPQKAAAAPIDAWAHVLKLRDGWMKAIEDARQAQGIDSPLDCGLTVPAFGGSDDLSADDLADLCGISRFKVGDAVEVADLRDQPRCDRSWKRDGTVAGFEFEEQAVQLSARDAAVLGLG